NPIGLDDPDNYSTARDLAALARRLMRERAFARIVDLHIAPIRSGANPRTVMNRNDLVRTVPFVDGVKTGHTRDAGYVLVGAGHRAGARIISAVLGDPSEAARDSDTLAVLRYGLSRFVRVHPVSAVPTLGFASVEFFSGVHVGLHAARDVRLSVRRGARVRTHVAFPDLFRVTGPMPAGATVGAVTVTVDGR